MVDRVYVLTRVDSSRLGPDRRLDVSFGNLVLVIIYHQRSSVIQNLTKHYIVINRFLLTISKETFSVLFFRSICL